MTPTTDPGKRIPKSLNTEANLIGSYTLTDAAVALTPGVIVVLGFQWLIPPGPDSQAGGYSFTLSMLVLPLAGVGVLPGARSCYLLPYTSSLGWLQAALGFHRSERDLDFELACTETRFERAHLSRNAPERQDGTLVGLVEVSAPLLALATPSEWAAHTSAFADFCNTTLEYPIQIYSTTRAFDVDSYLSTYEDRLSDPDVLANPRLGALIEGYIEWYETELASREMTIREHYVIVSVHPDSLTFESNSILQKASALPSLECSPAYSTEHTIETGVRRSHSTYSTSAAGALHPDYEASRARTPSESTPKPQSPSSATSGEPTTTHVRRMVSSERTHSLLHEDANEPPRQALKLACHHCEHNHSRSNRHRDRRRPGSLHTKTLPREEDATRIPEREEDSSSAESDVDGPRVYC